MMRASRLILFLLFLPLLSIGQHQFDYYDIDDGLSENSVTEIFQDSEGLLWFSTQDGLSQFDGYQFKNYNISSNDSTSLSDNYLWGLDEDSLGNIWVCSRSGLNRIDKKTGVCTQFFKKPLKGMNGDNQILDIGVYQGNVFALISNSIYKIPVGEIYSERINKIEESAKINLSGDTIFTIHQQNGKLFFVQNTGIYNYTSKKLTPFKNIEMGAVHNFLKTASIKEQMIFTNGRSVFYFETKTRNYRALDFNFNGALISDLETSEEDLWVATDNGIFHFRNERLLAHLVKSTELENSITSNFVAALCVDQTGKLWVGTSGNGINVYDPSMDKFKHLSKEVLGEDLIIRSVYQTNNKQLIVCSGAKIFALDLRNKEFGKHRFAHSNVKSFREISVTGLGAISPTKIAKGIAGDVIIGTKGNDLIILDSNLVFKKKVVLNSTQLNTNVISDIIISDNDEIWAATYYGVYLLSEDYDLVDSFLPHKKGLTTNYFLSVFEDNDNDIWLGSNKGLYKYQEKDKTFTHIPYQKNNLSKSPGFNFVCGFADDGKGSLWMGTYGGGLSKMNKEDFTFQHFTTEKGLANNVCNGLLMDNNQNIWLNTNKGLSRFNVKEEKFTNYSKGDGLHFNEFNLNSYHKNESGELFFGTPIGLVLFKPEDIVSSTFKPSILISAIDINYKKETQRLLNKELNIYPKDKVLTIHFAGLNFSKSDKIKYRYQLKGYDDGWVVTSELKANYTSIPDGEFVFLVDVTNSDGVWSENPKMLKVIVHPPIYKTWWFITLVIILSLAVIIFVIRYFSQRDIKKRLQELRVQQEINLEKQRISRDLHDNIGAQITYLISSIDQESYASKENQNVFEGLSDKARNVMNQLRQTLWVISKESISLEDFSQKVNDYSRTIFVPTNINVTISTSGNLKTILPPSIVSHLFKIIQEAQNNIIKHANASEVNVNLSQQEDNLVVNIIDNGKGLATPKKLDDHFGLKNMSDRATEMKGEFNIEKGRNSVGTKITIIIPLTN